MIELIIVIVVAGILAAVMIPKMERDNLREAANQVVRHIQFTQHLAMVDDVYDAAVPKWELSLWTITFSKKNCYTVYSGKLSRKDAAVDPATNTLLFSNNACKSNKLDNGDLLLEKKYNTKLTFSGCSGRNISFDNLGRPLKSKNIRKPITSKLGCVVTLDNNGRKAVITVERESGFTHITSFDSL